MKPVRDLDENDPDVLAHGDEHLPQGLHLLVFLGGVLNTGQLADALYKVGDGGGEKAGDVRMLGGGVLNDVVKEGGLDGLAVQIQLLRHDLGNRQRMDNIGFAALALLPVVALVGVFKGVADAGEVRRGIVPPEGLFQMLVLFLDGHGSSPRLWLTPPVPMRVR